MSTSGRDSMAELLAVMARLRDPEQGCPWDVQQTFRSIAPYTIEEAYEVADAIERNDLDDLRDELGDLLLQVVFHARMAEEQGTFAFDDVARAITDKMVRRHPHVFGDQRMPDAAEQTRQWEEIKAEERAERRADDDGPDSAIDGVSPALPGLPRAVKLTRRAARVGFDWPSVHGVFDKIREELSELEEAWDGADGDQDRIEDELGDLLFATANLARHLQVDPESALRRTIGKFERRFRAMEKLLRDQDLTLEEADFGQRETAWGSVKRREREGG